MMLFVPATPGDVADRRSILRLKLRAARSADESRVIAGHMDALPSLDSLVAFDDTARALVAALDRINERLWQLEDVVRETMDAPGTEAADAFVRASRSVPIMNDTRNHIKRRIDAVMGWPTMDVKIYEKKPPQAPPRARPTATPPSAPAPAPPPYQALFRAAE